MSRRNIGPTYDPPWWERATIPDLMTRGLNVGSGPPTMSPDQVDQVLASAPPSTSAPWLTNPGMRPFVYQRFANFNVTADVVAVPLVDSRQEVESLILNVYSTAGASAWWGYGSGTTPANGMEIQPGIPFPVAIDQEREQWELQRQLEYIAALLAAQTQNVPLAPYRAPRVVFDISTIWVAAAGPVNVSVMVFFPPELQ